MFRNILFVIILFIISVNISIGDILVVKILYIMFLVVIINVSLSIKFLFFIKDLFNNPTNDDNSSNGFIKFGIK